MQVAAESGVVPLDPTTIIDELKRELARRGRLPAGGAPSDPLQLAVLLVREFTRYPVDNARASLSPFNYCALPWVLGRHAWYGRALRAVLSPLCEDVPLE